ncbi:23S rRNA (guanosine(2251)-2'-O)-methyltransferase RlmB [Algiphilus sp.]|uniref:23S rRNA (guanosine(2251)-2'-O)-methyltransferase RlmB n=1 Tax=Algiphilus sp. TaxID=1872431 RepID=UPI001CA742A7|nr:23S rRNA (guanosine(2251)-2'-O)-methyltransferase RlmB [Algiphilus sp.]MBY8966395.1 23S rRNA (guanosine(2251)-2'-O)-methyltransferase RlmB [Algiphilus acroporae]MCI5061946.1 23S rRNA (guanosine(2251)-2'-O)-methyltransferase RlmB [Algiphilus sp.]MCI5104991.1 23S rRNA (guanosine(2251)-2'-O)-methyltransferase RlmB [Algiphilus sp.]
MADSERVIGGFHAVSAALEAAEPPLEVLLSQTRRDQRASALTAQAEARGVPLRRCGRDTLDLMLPGVRHQGVVARVAVAASAAVDADTLLYSPAPADGLVLVLDGIQDPHNLGACLRSAEAAGAQAVVIPRDRSVRVTPTVSKVAAGSAERVPVLSVTNLARALDQLRDHGYWICGLAGQAERSLWQLRATQPLALVMGAEGAGLRQRTRQHCDELVRIPMLGQAESLNVSVSTGVCLFEVARQRLAAD